MNLADLDNVCRGTEEVLNFVGYIPFVGKISAAARIMYAVELKKC